MFLSQLSLDKDLFAFVSNVLLRSLDLSKLPGHFDFVLPSLYLELSDPVVNGVEEVARLFAWAKLNV